MSEEKLQTLVHKFLTESDCPSKYIGFHCLRKGLCWKIMNPHIIGCLKKTVYAAIAEMYNTSVNNVERNIRTLIEKWWEADRCGGMLKNAPTNSELFHVLTAKLIISFELVC